MCTLFSFRNSLFLASLIAVASTQFSCKPAAPSAILEYEVDFGSEEDANPANMRKLIEVLNRRLSGAGIAIATTENNLRIEISRDTPEVALQKIRRSIETIGDLQFRITASPQFAENDKIIEAAQAMPENQNDLVMGNIKVAQWMPYDLKEFGEIDQDDPRIVKRKAGDVPQALVLTNDGFDVTGEYIAECAPALDELGKPQINFKFNDQGAFHFGQLTSTYLPKDNKAYPLAIIFNGKILTAPSIRSKIVHQGRISGLTDMDETEFIVSILNAGSLPYPIRLVDEQSTFRNWRAE